MILKYPCPLVGSMSSNGIRTIPNLNVLPYLIDCINVACAIRIHHRAQVRVVS